ncbi:MAG: nucleotide exchange factor GrpE [Patescibacteria group bacterium]
MAQENNDVKNNEADLKAKCEEYLNGWKRERADFLNYKKEEMERIGQLVKYANEEIILKLLPILDNICLAERHVPKDSANTGNSRENEWVEGFLQIKKQLVDFLEKEGIKSIDVLGKPFDANTMESVGVGEAKPAFVKDFGEAKEGIIVEEVQRGHTLHGKLIRPAKVKISK